MENLDSATIFWLFALGLVIGAVSKLALGRRGLGLIPNVVAGAFGTVTVGAIGAFMGLPGTMLFALLGSLSIIFIANVFNMQTEESH